MTIELTSADVPQEDDLGTVRLVVEAIGQGLQDTQGLAEKSGVSRRHVGYAINAAFVLGWVVEEPDRLAISPEGQKLLAQPSGSPAEKPLLRAAIEQSAAVQAIAKDLLAAEGPTRKVLSERIRDATGLSASTSERRAQTLLSWRRQVLGG